MPSVEDLCRVTDTGPHLVTYSCTIQFKRTGTVPWCRLFIGAGLGGRWETSFPCGCPGYDIKLPMPFATTVAAAVATDEVVAVTVTERQRPLRESKPILIDSICA